MFLNDKKVFLHKQGRHLNFEKDQFGTELNRKGIYCLWLKFSLVKYLVFDKNNCKDNWRAPGGGVTTI